MRHRDTISRWPRVGQTLRTTRCCGFGRGSCLRRLCRRGAFRGRGDGFRFRHGSMMRDSGCD